MLSLNNGKTVADKTGINNVSRREIYSSTDKDKFVLMYAMKAKGGRRGKASLIRKLDTRSRRTVSITSRSIVAPSPLPHS